MRKRSRENHGNEQWMFRTYSVKLFATIWLIWAALEKTAKIMWTSEHMLHDKCLRYIYSITANDWRCFYMLKAAKTNKVSSICSHPSLLRTNSLSCILCVLPGCAMFTLLMPDAELALWCWCTFVILGQKAWHKGYSMGLMHLFLTRFESKPLVVFC